MSELGQTLGSMDMAMLCLSGLKCCCATEPVGNGDPRWTSEVILQEMCARLSESRCMYEDKIAGREMQEFIGKACGKACL
jgi:hypothetical protein